MKPLAPTGLSSLSSLSTSSTLSLSSLSSIPTTAAPPIQPAAIPANNFGLSSLPPLSTTATENPSAEPKTPLQPLSSLASLSSIKTVPTPASASPGLSSLGSLGSLGSLSLQSSVASPTPGGLSLSSLSSFPLPSASTTSTTAPTVPLKAAPTTTLPSIQPPVSAPSVTPVPQKHSPANIPTTTRPDSIGVGQVSEPKPALPPGTVTPSARVLAERRLGLMESPSLLGEAICKFYEEEIEGEAKEAHSRVLAEIYQAGGTNSLLYSFSYNLLNSLTTGKGGITSFGFNTPSPDDIVQNARMNKDSDLFSKGPIVRSQPSSPQPFHKESSPARSQLTASLSSGNLSQKKGEEPSKTPKPQKIQKAKLNIHDELAERKKGKDSMNLVVVGHVDAGKSTLMGHLLVLLGEVSDKMLSKYERESQKIGKSSFKFAWALDETTEERERGITMDVATRKFETPNRRVTLLDAPGHRDFIPNMISGASQADVSILVVDATQGEFESGFEADGQTKEHALLIRSLGVNQLIVAVNKLDNMKWSRERFDEILSKLLPFLRLSGFKDKSITAVPCSGLTGENLVERTAPELNAWYNGPTLVQAIDLLQLPERSVDKPLRISISDSFKGSAGGLFATGRVEAGYVSKDDQLLLMPGNEIVTIKSLEVHEQACKFAVAGDTVTMGLTGIEKEHLSVSSILSDASSPIRLASQFVAQILVFDVKTPITKGETVVFHYLSMNEQATVTKLIGTVDKATGEIKQKNPRFLQKNSTAIVEIKTSKPICMETYKEFKELGRFTLRSAGKTVAAGIVQELKDPSMK